MPEIDFIKGWVRTSLIDYPGKIATVIYTGGCNLRCPFCHNPELLDIQGEFESINLNEILTFLQMRRGMVDGIVISGGEPLIHEHIFDLLRTLKERNLQIKIDTNGFFPERLKEILDNRLVDMVAMDIKASKDAYDIATGVRFMHPDKIEKSLHIIKTSNVLFELRTTIIPIIHTKEMIREIAEWIAPVDSYVLQQFRPTATYASEYRNLNPLPESDLNEMKQIAEQYIKQVHIRGIN